MNKTAIKNFAIWARNKLIADISYKAGLLGITEKEIKSPLPQSTQTVQFFDIGTKEPSSIKGIEIQQRKKLVEEIERKAKQSDYATAYKNVIEEVAYTWFNRLIAIRFMEVNDYLPTRIRVLSSESNGKAEPDLVTHALEANLDYSAYEKDRIIQLKHENKLDELFRMLFIKQCNALNANLPELFEKTSDFTELLLNVSFTDKEGVVYHLVNDVAEENWQDEIEIIGWLYQYYISEKHDEVIDPIRGKAIKKEDIPAATQLFTTDWVVRYMVDNSLGRYWIERNPKSNLRQKLNYFVAPKNGDIKYIDEKIDVSEITFFDPCVGSGHILVYAFDVLMEIYKECGYAERDAAQLIIKNNIFGLDIDNRAYQLAYFAVMMKGRSYDRRFLYKGIRPNISAIIETNELSKFHCDNITVDPKLNEIGEYLIKVFKDAKEIGSLLSVESKDYQLFNEYLVQCSQEGQLSIDSSFWFRVVKPSMEKVIKQANLMADKYSIVCTNPPYMNKFEGRLKSFIKDNYKPYSGDLFSVFMYRNLEYCKSDGYSAYMTPNVWMFIKTYENLRTFIIDNKTIISLIQMAKGAFFKEATVDICSFILKNQKTHEEGLFIRLEDFKGGMNIQKQKVLDALKDKNCGYFFQTNAENFSKIPGSPIAYWANNEIFNAFEHGKLIGDIADVKIGMGTGKNEIFVREWWEINFKQIDFSLRDVSELSNSKGRYFPYNKGGDYRLWYGNQQQVLWFDSPGRDYMNSMPGHRENGGWNYYFKQGLTWSFISSSKFGVRFIPHGFAFDVAGSTLFLDKEKIKYVLGFLSSKVCFDILSLLNPTLNYQAGNIKSLPVIFDKNMFEKVNDIVEANISTSRSDWDSFETSWNFSCHPLINGTKTIADAYSVWESEAENRFKVLNDNEEELNRIFINIYGLQDRLTPEIDEKDITVRKPDLGRDIRSFLSFAVGCMMGRYSLDKSGLVFAGGKWDDKISHKYLPDTDNILPISDEEYFQDDIVGRLVEFVRVVYGADTLEENLAFIANALGVKGNSSRQVIRNYFLKDFYKNHCQVYQKRPFYWLFESGKQNGFKALIYMHRYNENTIGNLRIDYLHRMQRIYENEIARMQDTIENSRDAREVATATKRKEKLIKQLQETKEYDEKIAHLALARTSIDLDDGVKVNYEKVQTDRDGKKLDVLAKI